MLTFGCKFLLSALSHRNHMTSLPKYCQIDNACIFLFIKQFLKQRNTHLVLFCRTFQLKGQMQLFNEVN